MKTSDSGDEAEPQPISWSASTPFEPVESPKYVLMLVSGDAWVVVGDRNYGADSAVIQLHRHLAGVAAVLDCVVDDIGNSIKQQVPVAGVSTGLSAII